VLPLFKGSVKKRTEQSDDFMIGADSGVPHIVVINHDSVWRKNSFGAWAMNQTWDMLVVDECHKAKTPSGRFSRYLAKIRDKCKYRIGLTGTPMPHSPLDLFAQFRFLDVGIFGSKVTPFKHRYAIFGGFEGRQVIGFRNKGELENKFDSATFRVKAGDVLDLPEATHVDKWCILDADEMRAYQEMKHHLVADLGHGVVTASNALVRLLRLQQIVQGTVNDEEGRSHRIGNTKMNLLMEIIGDMPKREPVAVFSLYTSDVERVHEVAAKLGRTSSELSGNRNQLAEWKKGETDILSVQLQSGGVGIDLTRARYCVYMSGTYNMGNYEQSLARVHRPGQERPVTYVHLLAENTIDVVVRKALRDKKNVVESVLAGLT